MTEEEIIEVCRGWGPDSLVLFYEWSQRESGFKLPPHLYPVVLGLCDTRIEKLQVQIGPGAGKSQLISMVYPAWMLGHDPQQTFLGISGAENLAQGFMSVVMGIVESNEAFRLCYPDVKPDKAQGWSNDRGAFVTGRRLAVPDAGFLACGLSSKVLTGKHARTVILDDLHDADNSATEVQCAQVVYKYTTQITGRADPMGARFVLAGRRWHEADLYGTLQDNGDWVTIKLPAERPGSEELWVDVTVPDGLECVFTDGICQTPDIMDSVQALSPEHLPEHRIRMAGDQEGQQVALREIQWIYGHDPKGQGFFWPESSHKRKEYFSNKRLNPSATEAVYQCNPGARQGVVFQDEDFERRYPPPEGLEYGCAAPEVKRFLERGALLVQAWDTAFSAETTSDYTVGITLMCVPCASYHRDEDPEQLGPCEHHFDIYVLDVYRERKKFAELVSAIKQQFLKWQPNCVVVEKKAYGVTLVETLPGAGIPVEGVTPGPLESKRARAVEGVGAGSVQGWCRQHRVVFPHDATWLQAFIREMKNFTGEKGGRDDQVDAFVHGVVYAIRNGVGSARIPGDWDDPRKVDDQMTDRGGADFAALFGLQESVDPFSGTCAKCQFFTDVIRQRGLKTNRDLTNLPPSYCTLHNQPSIGFGSCDEYSAVDYVSFPTH